MSFACINMRVISILLVVFLIISLLKFPDIGILLQAHLIQLHKYQVMRLFFSGLILNIFVFNQEWKSCVYKNTY